MKRILIIGCGQLGKRHLQSLALLENNLEISLVDPFPGSLEAALAVFEPNPSRVQSIKTFPSLNGLDELDFDIIINASTAETRLHILKEMHSRKLTYGLLILEKVLFQKAEDFVEAKGFMQEKKTYVNCPRRTYPFYQDLKKVFQSEIPFEAKFEGTSWGLCCNSIHYIDLFQYLSGSSPISIDTSELEKEVFPSKRPGFIEFFGTVSIKYANGSHLILTCLKTPFEAKLKISQGETHFLVDEGKGEIIWNLANSQEPRPIRVPFQSELTAQVANEFFNYGTCQLPTFSESMKGHLPLIKELTDFYSEITHKRQGLLPIT